LQDDPLGDKKLRQEFPDGNKPPDRKSARQYDGPINNYIGTDKHTNYDLFYICSDREKFMESIASFRID
jgi:hypothetical protein